MTSDFGTLYGIGVGPGDPDLITIKALNALRSVSRVYAACSTKNDYSIAEGVIAKHIRGISIERMPFPMTKDKVLLEEAWEENARKVIERLSFGQDVAFVTIGDPLTYSTFSYLLKAARHIAPDLKVEVIPGITAYHASAALACVPLAEGEESLQVISGANGGERLRAAIGESENVVVLKTYRRFDDICETLEAEGLEDSALCVMRCGLEGESVVSDLATLKGTSMPYLSLILLKKKGLPERLNGGGPVQRAASDRVEESRLAQDPA